MLINDKQMLSIGDIFVNNILYLQLRQKEQKITQHVILYYKTVYNIKFTLHVNFYILDKYIHLFKV